MATQPTGFLARLCAQRSERERAARLDAIHAQTRADTEANRDHLVATCAYTNAEITHKIWETLPGQDRDKDQRH
jgi:hypothetical protein